MFSCEIYESFKNIYFKEHMQTTASNDSISKSEGNKIVLLPSNSSSRSNFFFNKVAGFASATLLKSDSDKGVFL